MNLTSLISKNMRGLRYKYVTFLLSSVFSITIFYLFASFIMNPSVAYGNALAGSLVLGITTTAGLIACEVIIVVFSFFFIWYSSSAFIKSRSNEFGLLTTLGASKHQLSRMIFTESMIIGETAIGIGLLLGTLLLKMFLSAMSLILKVDSPIEFALAPQAILITFVGYTILFVVVGLINIRSLKKGQVVELSRASQRPKKPPVFSWVLGLFAVLCLSIGYYLAWTADGRTVLFRMLPVIGIVCVGTYFLFSQLSVVFLRTIKERKGLYFKGVNLLTISELRFKIQDNARVLSITAILTAVVITAVGTLDIGSQTLLEMREFEFPQALSVTIQGRLQPPELEKLDVSIRNEFQSRGLDVQSGMVLPGIMFRGAAWGTRYPIPLISEEDYKLWAEQSGAPSLEDILPGHAVMLGSYPWGQIPDVLTGDLESRVGLKDGSDGGTISFVVDRSIDVHLLNDPYSWVLVVDPANMHDLSKEAGPRDNLVLISYELSDWTQSLEPTKRIRMFITEQAEQLDFGILDFSSRVLSYQETRQTKSLLMFLAVFVAVLFSLGMGSMLHFRLFTDLEEDRARFASMKRLGVSQGEIRTVITRQSALLFFAPFVLGVVHSAFALKALVGALLSDSSISEMALPVLTYETIKYMMIPVVIFLSAQTAYFLISRKAYINAINANQS